MKSDIEIRDILYKAIKGSALEKAIGGKLYKTERPTNSGSEDIVISILDGLNGQIQDAVINVNIYVQDVIQDSRIVMYEPRIRELSRLAILLLEEVDDGAYHFEIEKQKCFKVNGVDEHCINNRIKLKITNF